jgi:hypothetical protein
MAVRAAALAILAMSCRNENEGEETNQLQLCHGHGGMMMH